MKIVSSVTRTPGEGGEDEKENKSREEEKIPKS